MKTKYITFTNQSGTPFLFTFPGQFTHKHMSERIIHAARRDDEDIAEVLTPVSAGFVSISLGHCYGESISMNLKSRSEDTELLESAGN